MVVVVVVVLFVVVLGPAVVVDVVVVTVVVEVLALGVGAGAEALGAGEFVATGAAVSVAAAPGFEGAATTAMGAVGVVVGSPVDAAMGAASGWTATGVGAGPEPGWSAGVVSLPATLVAMPDPDLLGTGSAPVTFAAAGTAAKPSGRSAKVVGATRGTCASASRKTKDSAATVHTTRMEHRSGSGARRRAPPTKRTERPAMSPAEASRDFRTGSTFQPRTPSLPLC